MLAKICTPFATIPISHFKNISFKALKTTISNLNNALLHVTPIKLKVLFVGSIALQIMPWKPWKMIIIYKRLLKVKSD